MKKGNSYNVFLVSDKPKHPIVKAIKEIHGDKFNNSLLIYASHWATDAGWCLDGIFLGYTIKESIKSILKNNLKS